MAKKEATKFSYGVFDKKHIENIKKRLKSIEELFDTAIKEGARIGETSGFNDPNKPFYLSDYPSIQERINDLMRSISKGLRVAIETGNREEWMLSCEKNNEMVDLITSSTGIPKDVISQWKQPNLEALSAFQQRKSAGMFLSDRVWRITEQFKQELELALDLGLGEGKSAASLSRDVRKYLNEPNRLFRRVRDKHGVLRLSKAAKAYHPGQGVYRSSYKNALRLTATENNMAYRMADSERWKQIPLVVGIKISISHNNHPVYDICDELQGTYPKDFIWLGWHPFCKCAAVAVMAKDEEFLDYQRKLLAGEDVSKYKFSGKIEDVPDNFKNWVNDNADRIKGAKKQPYFIRDNKKYVLPKEAMESKQDIAKRLLNLAKNEGKESIDLRKILQTRTEEDKQLMIDFIGKQLQELGKVKTGYVSIDNLHSVQDVVFPNIVERYVKQGTKGDLPYVVNIKGTNYIVDGNHRVVSEIILGKKQIKAQIITHSDDVLDELIRIGEKDDWSLIELLQGGEPKEFIMKIKSLRNPLKINKKKIVKTENDKADDLIKVEPKIANGGEDYTTKSIFPEYKDFYKSETLQMERSKCVSYMSDFEMRMQEKYSTFADLENMTQLAEYVDVSKVVASQPYVTKSVVDDMVKHFKDDGALTTAYRLPNGKIYINDGHHRAAAQILMGRKRIKMIVVDIPKSILA